MTLLEKRFNEITEETGEDGLDIDEFIDVFEEILGDTDNQIERRRHLNHLFMKIDANCDGGVDWEEFLNFLLLQNQGNQNEHNDENKYMIVRQQMPKVFIETYNNHHSNMINNIILLKEQSKYATGRYDIILYYIILYYIILCCVYVYYLLLCYIILVWMEL